MCLLNYGNISIMALIFLLMLFLGQNSSDYGLFIVIMSIIRLL